MGTLNGEFKICGIIGCAGDLNLKDEKAFKNMLVFDSVRGEDSTGVAAVVKHGGAVNIAKEVGHPFNLFDTKRFDKLMFPSNRVLIGHNRYATQGAVNAKNAHPFDFDGLVGVHNGTLQNKHVLEDHKEFQVDSENLYHHIHLFGLKDAIKRILGAWALVWWDKDEETLNLLRNKERPLYLCYSEDVKRIYWASEDWMLDIALQRNDIKYHAPFLIEEDMHYKIHIKNGGDFGKPVVEKVVSEAVPFVQGNSRGKATNTTTGGKSQQQQGGNGVVHLKASNPASRYDLDYLGSKDVLLEAMATCMDCHGAEYVACFDKEKPFYEVRLYCHNAHDVDMNIGCEFTGNISAFSPTNSTGEGFYKVSPSSVRHKVAAEDQSSVKEEVLYPTAKGEFLREDEWRKVHEACACCQEPVSPLENRHRFTTYNDLICGDCISNENELLQYVTLK